MTGCAIKYLSIAGGVTLLVYWVNVMNFFSSYGLRGAKSKDMQSWNSAKCQRTPFQQLVDDVHKKARPKRVLVTGGAGFIGSHVASFCHSKLGFETYALDDLSGGFMRNIPEGVTFLKVDVKNASAVEKVFADHGPFDYVYHLAAYAAEGLSHFIRNFNYRNNLEASTNIINSAVRSGSVKCIVFTSSIASFGTPETLPLVEESPRHPEDPYGIAKLAAEQDLKAATSMFGIDNIVFYPHNVYGPGQNIADKFRNAVGIFMNQILHGDPMTIFGDGRQTRGFSYIDDVAPLIAASPEIQGARNESFFVGADDYASVYDLSVQVAAAMNVPHKVKHLHARNEVTDAWASHDKLRCFFNPPKPVPMTEGLKRTAENVLHVGKFEPTGFSDIEVWKNMPPSWKAALDSWSKRKPSMEVV